MSKQRYHLEIYTPGSRTEVSETLYSDTPFGAIAKGDFFGTESTSGLGMGSIRVADVEHLLWNSQDGVKHKVCVYTEKVRPA